MLLQKARIGKTAVLVTVLIILGSLTAMPLLLQADATREADSFLFLPMIYNQVETDSTPNPITESTATPTFTASPTIHPTITASVTPSSTATATPTSTPVDPYVIAMPNCGPGPNITFNLYGANWPTNQSLTVFWEGIPQMTFQANTIPGSFSTTWSFSGLINGIYTVSALSGTAGATASTQIYIPCGIQPTSTPTPTETPSPTSTPVKPYIVIMPDCGPGPTIFFYVQGYYWPVNESVTLTWNDNPMMVLQAGQHSGNFSFGWTFEGMTSGLYKVSAISGTSGITSSDYYTIPCGALITPTAMPTPEPADLVIGQPILISTPPVIAYQPLAFEVPITNTGGVDINTLFFVDLLFDPTPVHYRDVYTAVSNLAGNSSITLTITSTIGLANYLGPHQITGVVDSLDHVVEANEDNNSSPVLEIPFATPGNTPTNTPEPVGTGTISGIVRRIQGKSIPMERAAITAIDEANGIPIASTYSDANGYYELNNLPDNKTYTIQACIIIDSDSYFGVRSGQTPPNMFADIILNKQPCP